MPVSFPRPLRFAALSCALTCAAAATAEEAKPASAPGRAAGAQPAHVHIDDPACWPTYPAPASAPALLGRPTIRLGVDADGTLIRLKLEHSSGPTPEHFALDKSVAAAFARCAIDPARDAEGRPVAGDTLVTWTWNKPGTAATSGTASVGMPAIPLLTQDCLPPYPPDAVRSRATGATGLHLAVDASGHVIESTVIRSSGRTRAHGLLDEAARSYTAQCRHQPALDEGGQPIASQYDFSYVWRIE